jgi:transcriptional regulator GlxA family with amidase domain
MLIFEKKTSMKHLSILVPSGQSDLSTVACVVGACEMFETANKFWQENGRSDLFKVQLAGVSKEAKVHDGLVTLTPHINIADITKTSLIIIPSTLIRSYEAAEKENRQIIDWIGQQYKEGAEIASICTGAFMLAAAGVLNGKTCSTHWSLADTFRKSFPEVHIQVEKLITDEKGIYTNGGGYSFLNLVLYLIEKYYDRQTAIYCSKVFQVEIDRQSQSAFVIFKGQKEHTDDMVREAQVYIENNLQEKISVEHLSSKFAIGRRHFDRRFIKATGNTPLEYLQRVKIESAKRSFETTRKTINEVMYEVGYSDVKAFREVFRKVTGISPLEYITRYNKNASIHREAVR